MSEENQPSVAKPVKPCQTVENLHKKRAFLIKKAYRLANDLITAKDIEGAAIVLTLLEKQYQFDRKHGLPEAPAAAAKLGETGQPVTLSIHQEGSIESKREKLMGRIKTALGSGHERRGDSGHRGVDGRVTGAG